MPLHFNFLYQEYPNNILGTNFYWIICITFKSFQTKLKCPRNVSEKASGTSTWVGFETLHDVDTI